MNDTGGTILCHSCKLKLEWAATSMLGMSTKTGKAMLAEEANMLIAKLTQHADAYGFGKAGYYLHEFIKALKRYVWFRHEHKSHRIQVLRANEKRPSGIEGYKEVTLPDEKWLNSNWNLYGEWMGGYL